MRSTIGRPTPTIGGLTAASLVGTLSAKREAYWRIQIQKDAPPLAKQHADAYFRSGRGQWLHDTEAGASTHLESIEEPWTQYLFIAAVKL